MRFCARGRTIADTRIEIASFSAPDLLGRELPSAHDELDAVIAHTAASTNTILEACEQLDRLTADVAPETAAALRGATTAIYEACSFQDITGQRIKKVVSALQLIDSKVTRILRGTTAAEQVLPLASGPQLPGVALGQASVDQLLASLG